MNIMHGHAILCICTENTTVYKHTLVSMPEPDFRIYKLHAIKSFHNTIAYICNLATSFDLFNEKRTHFNSDMLSIYSGVSGTGTWRCGLVLFFMVDRTSLSHQVYLIFILR